MTLKDPHFLYTPCPEMEGGLCGGLQRFIRGWAEREKPIVADWFDTLDTAVLRSLSNDVDHAIVAALNPSTKALPDEIIVPLITIVFILVNQEQTISVEDSPAQLFAWMVNFAKLCEIEIAVREGRKRVQGRLCFAAGNFTVSDTH